MSGVGEGVQLLGTGEGAMTSFPVRGVSSVRWSVLETCVRENSLG